MNCRNSLNILCFTLLNISKAWVGWSTRSIQPTYSEFCEQDPLKIFPVCTCWCLRVVRAPKFTSTAQQLKQELRKNWKNLVYNPYWFQLSDEGTKMGKGRQAAFNMVTLTGIENLFSAAERVEEILSPCKMLLHMPSARTFLVMACTGPDQEFGM